MLTYEGANALLNCLTGRSDTYSYSTVYVGLSTTAPGRDSSGLKEPTGNGYARVLLGQAKQAATQKIGAASFGTSTNSEIIYFPEATGAWEDNTGNGTLEYFCLFSAETGGTLIAYGHLVDENNVNTSITPAANTVPIIRAQNLTLSLQ